MNIYPIIKKYIKNQHIKQLFRDSISFIIDLFIILLEDKDNTITQVK